MLLIVMYLGMMLNGDLGKWCWLVMGNYDCSDI